MNKKIQFVIMFVAAAIISIWIFYFDSAPTSYRFHKLFYEESYQGIVNEIYIDKKNHSNKTVKCSSINGTKDNFAIRTPDGNQRIFERINVGDTLLKQPNTDFIIIQGVNKDTLRFDLRFPD